MALETQDSWKRCPTTNCPCPNHTMAIPPFSPCAPDAFNEDPAFRHVSQTNDPPDVDVIPLIRLSLDALQSQRAPLRTSISELEALRTEICSMIDERLRPLKEEEQKLSDAITLRKAILSPIRRLPPEILSLIFLRSIRFPDFSGPNGDWPWAIERVCNTWRTTIIAYPYFWSLINIYVGYRTFRDRSVTRLSFSRIETQVSRARHLPLSVMLTDSDQAQVPVTEELVAILARCASRVDTLYLTLGRVVCQCLRASSLEGSFQSLSTLFVCSGRFAHVDTPISIEGCPNLRHLETYGVSRPLAQLALPWHQIEKYYSHIGSGKVGRRGVGMITIEDLLELLARASQLRKGLFRLQSNTEDVHPTTPPVQCKHLEFLELQEAEPTTIPVFRQLFQSLIFPCLTTLNIPHCKGVAQRLKYGDVFTAIVDAIIRSCCPLTSLYYEQGYISYEDIGRLPCATPTIRRLELRDVGCPGITEVLNIPGPPVCTLKLHGDGKVYVGTIKAPDDPRTGRSIQLTISQCIRSGDPNLYAFADLCEVK